MEPINEPLLAPENTRYTLYPIRHNDIYKHYKDMEEVIWAAQKIDFSKDLYDFKTYLTSGQQHIVKMFIALFSSIDGIINEGLSNNFINAVTYLEAQMMYTLQMFIEGVHNETYSLMLEYIIDNVKERMIYVDSIKHYPSIQGLKNWLCKYLNDDNPFVVKLVVQGFFEGVILLSLLTIPYQIKKITSNNRMPGFIRGNEYIFRDESYHKTSSVILYNNHIINKLSDEKIYELGREAVEVVDNVYREMFDVKLLGFNLELVSGHVRYLCDSYIKELGVKSGLYNINSSPISYMNSVQLDDNPSFFEVEVTNYRDSDIHNESKIINYDDNDNNF